jgi:hypothetical protein
MLPPHVQGARMPPSNPLNADPTAHLFMPLPKVQDLQKTSVVHAVSGRANRRMIVIGASAGGVLLLGIIIVASLAGSEEPPIATPRLAAKIDAGAQAPPPPAIDAGVAEVPADTGSTGPVPVQGECLVEITSVPPGAEVLSGETVIWTTPASLSLPCDVETKLGFRKERYANTTKKFTPSADKPRLKVTLGKSTFSVKVSSTPAGATVTVGGKPVGVTPTTVKLPAFEASTLNIAKDGFATEVQKITPKQNNSTVHATLKRKPRG